MDYGAIAVSIYGLLVLFCMASIFMWLFKEEAKEFSIKLSDLVSSDQDKGNWKRIGLFALGIFLLIAGGCINGITGATLTFLGLFSFYALIRDLSPTVNGISFPNAHKIVIALIALVAVGAVMTGLVQMTWAENTAEAIGATFDGINGLIDTFLTNLDQIKEFLEWYKEFSTPVIVGGGL